MSKINFEMSKELLRTVIFEQAGSIEKAIEECIQNSLDANSTKLELDINEYAFSFRDNGKGMNYREIHSFFKTFGMSEKRGNDDKIGQFGLGRGQIFAFGLTTWKTNNYQMIIDAKKSLDFEFTKLESNIKGTTIHCKFYDSIYSWRITEIIDSIKSYVIIDDSFEFYINGNKIESDYNIIMENDNFIVITGSRYINNIYSQNLFVKAYDSYTDYSIICKNKMKLNLARNSFLEDDSKTLLLKDLIRELESQYFLSIDNFDYTEGKEVIRLIKAGKLDKENFLDKKIIELADDSMVSINELKGKKCYFGYKDPLSDNAIKNGYTVINKDLAYFLKELVNDEILDLDVFQSKELSELVDRGYYKEVSKKELFKYGSKALKYFIMIEQFNRDIFQNDRTLLIGNSDVAKAYTDGYSSIHLNYIIFSEAKNQQQCLLEAFECLIHEYAHETEDLTKCCHDSNFYKRYNELMSKYLPKFSSYVILKLREIDIF